MIRAKRLSRWRGILFGIGCCLFVYLLIRLGTAEIIRLLLNAGWRFPFIVMIYVVYSSVRTTALATCISTGERYSYWNLLGIFLAGEAIQYLTFTGPFLAEPSKALLLRSRGIRTIHAFAAVISEYLIYTLTSAAMAVAGLGYMLRNFEVSPTVSIAAQAVLSLAGIFLLTSAVAIMGRIYLIGAIVSGARKLPGIGRFVRIGAKEMRDMEDLLFEVLRARPWRFLSIVGIEFAAQAILVLEVVILLKPSVQPLPLVYPFLIESAAKFISVGFSFIPAQVGASEGVYALTFAALGLPASAGFGLALARRLRSLVIGAAGMIFLARSNGSTAEKDSCGTRD